MGGRFFIENPKWGVSRGERGRGGGRVSGRIGEFGGPGGEILFFGAEMSTKENALAIAIAIAAGFIARSFFHFPLKAITLR